MITKAFIVQLAFLLYLKMSVVPVTFVYSKNNNQCLAESAVSVTCPQISRASFLNYGWGD